MMTARPSTIDEESLRHLVYRFYERVRDDALLGPVFERAIGTDDEAWQPHLQTMTAFWQTVILHKGSYKGNPLASHMALDGIQPAHFARWLTLFEQVAAELYDEAAAAYMVSRAKLMRQHLTRNLFGFSA